MHVNERRRRYTAAAFFASCTLALALIPEIARAQANLVFTEDATLAPRGVLRVRALTAWSRYDEVFAGSGTRSIGAFLTADSLGAAQVPALGGIQTLVQNATGSAFSLTLGKSTLGATAREEVLPIALEYGISRRFAVSVVTPIVRRRVAAVFQLDTTGVGANVGPNPQRTSAGASQVNAQVQAEFASAASQLQARLQACQSNPGASGCAALLARQSEAQQLIQSSATFASTLADLYGSAASDGAAFVPMAASAAQQAVASRIGSFNTQYQDLLGTSANLLQAVPRGAGGPAGTAEFEQYAVGELGGDSISTQERLRFGDVEIGAKALVIDRPLRPGQTTSMMLSVGSSVRLPTGSRQTDNQIASLASGSGSVVIDTRAFFDARFGRFGILAGGSFAASVKDVDTSSTSLRNARWSNLQIAPRWHLSAPLSVFGAYAMQSADKTGGDHLLGGGVSYSTLALPGANPRALPIEMRFTHLEAVAGDAGQPKFFRDQVELRLYFRLF